MCAVAIRLRIACGSAAGRRTKKLRTIKKCPPASLPADTSWEPALQQSGAAQLQQALEHGRIDADVGRERVGNKRRELTQLAALERGRRERDACRREISQLTGAVAEDP